MSEEAIFDVGTLADAVGRASKIAPTKGAAFDKAAGLVIEVNAMDTSVVIRATNLEVSYREIIDAAAMPTGSATWRMNAALFAGIVAGLPRTQQATLRQEGSILRILCGKVKAKLRLQEATFYPVWNDFDENDCAVVPNLSKRLKQTAWATDSSLVPFTGVHINGEHLIGTDRYKLVRVPCEVPIDKPVTVPLSLVAPVLPDTDTIRMGAENRRLLLVPSDNIKIYTVIFDAAYPSAEKLAAVTRSDFTVTAEFVKSDFLDVLSRLLILVKSERYPRLKINTTATSMSFYMNVPDVGEMEDEIPAKCSGDYEIFFTPEHLVGALSATPEENIKMSMGPEPHRSTLFEDGKDYFVWVMPRKEV